MPAFFLAPFAGHIVDKKEKRSLFTLCIALFSLISFGLFWLTSDQIENNWSTNSILIGIYSLVFFGGVLRAFFGPTIFSLIALITFSLIFLILGKLNFKAIDYVKITIREIVYRSSFIVSAPENYLKKTYQTAKNHFIIYNDYFEIQSEINELKAQSTINNFIIAENKRLKKIVDDYVIESEEIVAKVLIDKKSPFLRSIIINKGSKNNIKLGMAVLDGNYLVGKVVEVNYLTSRILLLSDLNSKIPVSIEPGGYQSILSGTGKDNGTIQFEFIDL